jgi:hypothetical protein
VRLTLSKAKQYLAHKAPNDKLDYRLNRVCERYLLSGKFAGSMVRLALAVQFGQVALPQEFRTLEGAKVSNCAFGEGRVFDITNRWWRWLPGKGTALGDSLDVIEDFGDGEAVMAVPYLLPTLAIPANDYRAPLTNNDPRYDFPAGQGTFQAVYSGSDSYPVTIYGRDKNENPVTLVLPDKSAYANPFARIERIHTGQIPVTIRINFTLPSPDSRVLAVAIIDGVQEETFFRRYFIPVLASQETAAIDAFVKRRHLEFTSDQDVLPFTNVGALGLGLDAYELEANGDKTGANGFWNDGIALLNAELGDMHAADEIPSIRFHYPGRTGPRLTSHM